MNVEAQVVRDAVRWPGDARRVLFLGDSITHDGRYIADLETYALLHGSAPDVLYINAGLPSETVSGLSEAGHADGAFPRPVLRDRLIQTLDAARPDLVVACYGMNDGIYLPWDKDRFAAFCRGMQELHHAIEAQGIPTIFVTPPVYDGRTSDNTFYNDVLANYAAWMREQVALQGWRVIDLHGPMTRELAWRREADPAFRFADDAIHPGDAGHWFIAKQLIGSLGWSSTSTLESAESSRRENRQGETVFRLVSDRQHILRDSVLTSIHHKRPGLPQGLPVDEAERQASVLTEQIRGALDAE